MTRDDLEVWLKKRGYEKDRWGHYQKTRADGTKIRMRLSKIAVRHEVKSPGFGQWVRTRSGYFKNLSLSDEGKLQGMKR